MLHIGIQGYEVAWEDRPQSNLVFLLDVSGSMGQPDKLPLVKQALEELITQLDRKDRVAIVVYAGASGLVLPSTTADNQETILHALNQLHAGGSTNGGAGIELAYATAERYFVPGGNNRIVLCTDGDFNVGMTSRSALVSLIEEKAKSGIFLTICGFGQGNFHDATMEELSNKGNGNYAYLDSEKEARKVFGTNLMGTMLTIAKDVKIQVEFNPQHVQGYRLIGYENRMLEAEDFNDDTKDAGEIGAGHSVTAVYEIIPVGVDTDALASVDDLKYQKVSPAKAEEQNQSPELATVKFRYKEPDSDTSTLLSHPVGAEVKEPSSDFQFIMSVAEFGQILRNPGDWRLDSEYDRLIATAKANMGNDRGGLRSEFIDLLKAAKEMSRTNVDR